MHFSSIDAVYFSPTGTTKRVLEAIATGLGLENVTLVDLTMPGGDRKVSVPDGQSLALFGMPVYAGRIPQEALARLEHCQGQATPAVLVVVYGNRAYEDALLELSDVVGQKGFVPVAAGAFIGEHSFSNAAAPIAVGRPDAGDCDKATAFGAAIRRKLDGLGCLAEAGTLSVPGNRPYRERHPLPAMAPVSRGDVCLRCGLCATVCPVGAITVAPEVDTCAETCLHCCACVKICPTGARVVENPKLLEIAKRLATNCAARKEPETYL